MDILSCYVFKKVYVYALKKLYIYICVKYNPIYFILQIYVFISYNYTCYICKCNLYILFHTRAIHYSIFERMDCIKNKQRLLMIFNIRFIIDYT